MSLRAYIYLLGVQSFQVKFIPYGRMSKSMLGIEIV